VREVDDAHHAEDEREARGHQDQVDAHGQPHQELRQDGVDRHAYLRDPGPRASDPRSSSRTSEHRGELPGGVQGVDPRKSALYPT
jgi:hypothetical protein